MTVYLDCNATTPMEPRVLEAMLPHFTEEYGNAGSRTHVFGQRAKEAVDTAREQVAAVVDCQPGEVIFTSGATESNNLAILGLQRYGEETGRRHIISTQIEHKAVLAPLQEMRRRGFTVDLIPPTKGGWVHPEAIYDVLRDDTLLVSVMHVNNETGVIQPIENIAMLLDSHPALLHSDAAQGFGKELSALRNHRIDFISISSHKIYGPKGIGALITRRQRTRRSLQPSHFGGQQERGIRPGTVPVPLVVGFGKAAALATSDSPTRRNRCLEIRTAILEALTPFAPTEHGDLDRIQPHVLSVAFDGIDAEAALLVLRDDVAASTGSACTSATYEPSHVLTAMGVPVSRIHGALRLSWSHLTPDADWPSRFKPLRTLRQAS